MQFLLDTHVLLWWLNDPSKLSKKIRLLIEDTDNVIYVSSVSFWEMAIKKELGKLSIPTNIISLLALENIQTLSLSAEESLSVVDLPKIHKDPFDRMLIIQAKLNGLILISNDQQLQKYPITIIN